MFLNYNKFCFHYFELSTLRRKSMYLLTGFRKLNICKTVLE